MPPPAEKAAVGAPASSADLDVAGDRHRLLAIGMAAVFIACAIFAPARLAIQLSSGKLTPWWANAAGAAAMALLYLWYRRDPAARTSVAAHGTALVATLALLVPVAYGMSSTIWWLSLVGFAMVLLGRPREAWAWGALIIIIVLAATLLEPHVQISGAAGEPTLERSLARVVFAALLIGMAAAFRRTANRRAIALVRASEARSRFLAHVSHEIRTPLHGVLSMLDLALRAELPAEAQQQVATANESAAILLRLLNNVLDLTRAESDALVLDEQPFSLHAALAEVLRPLAAEARSRGLAFTATAAPGLAELRHGDRFRVCQIALNLVGNALKFTPGGSIGVRLEAEPDDPDFIRLEVADTGPGIDEASQAAIFTPFTQGEGARAYGGAGLGLAIVRELATRMHGRVWVESSRGRGSRFAARLRLPSLDPAPGPGDLLASPPAPAPPPAAVEPQAQAIRILVCEDDPINQTVVAAMLRRLGHSATLVVSGEEALSALGAQRFDLLLTDIELPTIDGIELTRRVRQREQALGGDRLLVVATTAHVGADERQRLLSAGIDVHLPKPFDLAALEGVLQQAAALAGSRTSQPA
jgi:signal transduction histidine kinase/ActR/RegA family two-component response regulator